MGWFDERLRNIQNQERKADASRRRAHQNATDREARENHRLQREEGEKAKKVYQEYIKPHKSYVDSLMTSMGSRYWGRFRFGREFESHSWGAVWRVGVYRWSENRLTAINSLDANRSRQNSGYDGSKHYFEVRGGPGENGQTGFTVPIMQNGEIELIRASLTDLPNALVRAYKAGSLIDYNPFNLDKS